jgi:Amt family ammonium transporter
MTLDFCLVCILLIPLAATGLALIHQGLGRSRSAAHAMLATLCALAIAAIVFVLIGSSWMGFPAGLAHSFHLAGKSIDWLGAEPSFAKSLTSTLSQGHSDEALVLTFGIFAVGLATLIPISAGTDRWRLAAICAVTGVSAAITFPLFAHWVWSNGWLAQLTPLFNLPCFTDLGGAAVLNVLGGLTALSVAWILGPRQGKYNDGIAAAIPGHNIVQVLFGCMLSLIGWIGLDCAASILFHQVTWAPVLLTVINAVLSASAGCLAAVLTTQVRYRKPDASLSALVTLLVESLELRLLIDDPGGAISVHLGAGLWGILAFGLFGPTTGSRLALLLAQLIGIATLLGLMFPLIHLINRVLNKLIPFRVDADGDWQGMDIRELGAGAYPEFVVHADEFVPR